MKRTIFLLKPQCCQRGISAQGSSSALVPQHWASPIGAVDRFLDRLGACMVSKEPSSSLAGVLLGFVKEVTHQMVRAVVSEFFDLVVRDKAHEEALVCPKAEPCQCASAEEVSGQVTERLFGFVCLIGVLSVATGLLVGAILGCCLRGFFQHAAQNRSAGTNPRRRGAGMVEYGPAR